MSKRQTDRETETQRKRETDQGSDLGIEFSLFQDHFENWDVVFIIIN